MTNDDIVPQGPLIRLHEFPEYGVPTKEPATIKDWIERRGFPKPYRLGYRTHVYSLAEIQAWLASMRAA